MVNGNAVNCEQIWLEISNYVDGEVEATLRSAMEEHFRICPRCTSLLSGVRNVTLLYGDERMLEVPAGFSRRMEKRLARGVREDRRRWSTWSAWLVPVAALLLIAGGVRLSTSMTYTNMTYTHAMKSPMAQPAHGIPPDMVVLVAAGTRVFHVAGCTFIHNKEQVRSLTAKEAIAAGYVPCLRCMRKYLDEASIRRIEASGILNADADNQELRPRER